MRQRSWVRFPVQPYTMILSLRKHRLTAIIFALLIAIEIFYFSSIPGSKTESAGISPSIIYHFIVFFLLTVFLLYSFSKKEQVQPKNILLPTFIALLYAASDEIHQLFVPLRTAGLFDVFIDTIGISLATLLFLFVERNKKRSDNET
jgi:VanZ family protein